MNHQAQKQWKEHYRKFVRLRSMRNRKVLKSNMRRFTREAALERKLEAAQRKIEEQKKQLDGLGRAYDAMRDTVMDLMP